MPCVLAGAGSSPTARPHPTRVDRGPNPSPEYLGRDDRAKGAHVFRAAAKCHLPVELPRSILRVPGCNNDGKGRELKGTNREAPTKENKFCREAGVEFLVCDSAAIYSVSARYR